MFTHVQPISYSFFIAKQLHEPLFLHVNVSFFVLMVLYTMDNFIASSRLTFFKLLSLYRQNMSKKPGSDIPA